MRQFGVVNMLSIAVQDITDSNPDQPLNLKIGYPLLQNPNVPDIIKTFS